MLSGGSYKVSDNLSIFGIDELHLKASGGVVCERMHEHENEVPTAQGCAFCENVMLLEAREQAG